MNSNNPILQVAKRGSMEKTVQSVNCLLIVKPVTSQTVLAIDVIVISQDLIAYKVYFAIPEDHLR